MLILFSKSLQPGLFDKVVNVAASVSKDGVVRAPHTAIRHVRAAGPKPAAHHVPDLFTNLPPQTRPKRPETLDLFAERPKSNTSAEHVKETAKTEHVDYHDESKAKREAAAARVIAKREERATAAPPAVAVADHSAKVDYSKPFDEMVIPSFGVEPGTSKDTRRAINARVAGMVGGDLLGRAAPDVDLMRQYSGNGGCGDSLNEFYTDPKVAAAMWAAMRSLGVGEGASVLEPSCATGVFMEVAPAGVTVTGVELDPISARVGVVLHPGHEIKNSSLESFATQDTRTFDAVVGNAPFGLRGSLLSQDKKDIKTAEGYFLDTSLDKTRGGGVVAMIVPTGVLDSARDRKLRQRLLCKGEFLGALRMPNTAFEHSHTGVTTDVVFFRRRPEDVAGALGMVDQATLKKLGIWDEEFLAGSYFTERGAGNVLGTMTEGWRAKAGMGDDITVEGSMAGVPEAIAAFMPEPAGPELSVADILSACTDEDMREKARGGAARKPYDTSKRGDVKMIDGVEYILEGDPPRWHRVDEFMADRAVIDAQALSIDIERAINGEDIGDLADRVREYVEANGNPSKNANLQIAAAKDRRLFRLIGAVKPDGTLSDLVAGRKVVAMESSFDAAAQTLALEVEWFTPEQVAGRWHGGDAETVLDHLYASPDYAFDPATSRWTSSDQFLTGELWPKLDAAREQLANGIITGAERAKVERQAKQLEDAIDPKSLEDVELTLSSAFLPLNVIAAYFNRDKSRFEGQHAPKPMTVTFDKGVYAVSGGAWGNAALLDKYLNRTGVKKEDELPQVEAWNRDFKEWLCGSEFREDIEELYNRTFRGFRQRDYSDKPFDVPGLNDEGLKNYQWSGLRWALEAGKGIIAADVGLGKTARGLILARLLKSTGRAKRPMIIVPKTVASNWMAEAEKWFPGSSVLVIGETYTRGKDGKLKAKPDDAAERNRKFHDVTQNEYDFVLITQPAWNELDLDPVTKGKYVEDDFWVQRGDALGNAGDKRTNKIRESYNQAVANREFASRSNAIYFNDLGVDALIGDEMHAYKNLYAAKNRQGQAPKFLGGSGLSNRALDMALKTRFVRDSNGGNNVFGLTATPTKNSPLEIYSMLTHIAPEAFERIGIRNSEEFLDRFCEFESRNILSTTGHIEEAVCVTGFKNLDELRGIMRRYIDRKTALDVGLALPKRDDRQHLVDMSAEQKTVYAELRKKAELAKGKKDSTGDAHIFSIMNKMGQAAMDLEIYDPVTYAGAASPKYDEAATHIAAGAAEGGQVVFAESLAVHDKLVNALVAKGIPRGEIGIINAQAAASSAQRQNIADAFNAGKLKVVIGNATMSEGINLQVGTTDIHHMDLPWEPASMQQRNGRGLRQGNLREAVRIHTYLAKGSFDGYRYQSMMAKGDWQDLLWNGGDRVANLALEGAMSREDMMVMLSENPDEAREKLATNKAAAEERFKAQKISEAGESFNRYQDMKRSLRQLKPADREKPAAQRLQVKHDRLRLALEGNEHFTAKHALDAAGPILLQPQTGVAFEPGVAFDVEKNDGAIHGGGKFLVTGVVHDAKLGPALSVRRYGEATGGRSMTVPINDLAHGVSTFDYDEKEEQAEIGRMFAAAAESKMSALKGLKDLHGLPSSVIQASYDVIQKQAKAGVMDYKFETGYGDLGLVGDNDTPRAVSAYNARAALDTHDLMLPTDAHRKLAIDAYVADELGKKMVTEHVPGRRGRHTGETKQTLKYPGDSYTGAPSNRWSSIGKNVFGEGFGDEAHAVFERQQLDRARHAPTLREAISHAAMTATGQYNTVGAWSKRALAIVWAKAKREGKLDAPMSAELERGLPQASFNMSGNGIHKDGSTMTVRAALSAMAAHRNLHDLGAAMAVAGAPEPQQAVRELFALRPEHIGPGLRHIVTKHPDIANRPAGDFARIDRARAAYSYGGTSTPAHPLHDRFGDAAHQMTLADMATRLTANDDEAARDAA